MLRAAGIVEASPGMMHGCAFNKLRRDVAKISVTVNQ
jgi:hypothetical protein